MLCAVEEGSASKAAWWAGAAKGASDHGECSIKHTHTAATAAAATLKPDCKPSVCRCCTPQLELWGAALASCNHYCQAVAASLLWNNAHAITLALTPAY
jgi:hypothetical protein